MGGLHVECDCEMKRESIIIGLLVGSKVLTFKLGSLFLKISFYYGMEFLNY